MRRYHLGVGVVHWPAAHCFSKPTSFAERSKRLCRSGVFQRALASARPVSSSPRDWNLAVRLYVRGGWPRGFGVGAATSMLVIEGVAATTPRLELFYRFVLFSHLAIRINGVLGGLFLWDTALGDARPGPPAEEHVDGTISGFLIGVGLSIGWSSEPSPSRHRRRRRP